MRLQHSHKHSPPVSDSQTYTPLRLPPSPPLSPYSEGSSDLDDDDDAEEHRQGEGEGKEEERVPCTYLFSQGGSMIFHHIASTNTTITTTSMATHMTVTLISPTSTQQTTPPQLQPQPPPYAGEYTVKIHETGNLLEPAHKSPVLHSLSLRFPVPSLSSSSPSPLPSPSANTSPQSQQEQHQFPLREPLEVGVGGQGIIGRRVTIWQHHHHFRQLLRDGTTSPQAENLILVAEGVLGFN